MAEPFIPPRDADARDFMLNFANVIAANPAVYMLSSADALTISNTVNASAAAYTLAVSPPTRTELTVSEKDQTRISAV
jgi:hypothetical protein